MDTTISALREVQKISVEDKWKRLHFVGGIRGFCDEGGSNYDRTWRVKNLLTYKGDGQKDYCAQRSRGREAVECSGKVREDPVIISIFIQS